MTPNKQSMGSNKYNKNFYYNKNHFWDFSWLVNNCAQKPFIFRQSLIFLMLEGKLKKIALKSTSIEKQKN